MKKNFLFLFIILLSLPCWCQPINDLRKIFDYDKGEDLDLRILSTVDTVQGTMNEIIFNGGNGLKITGSLIIPKQKIREFPAIIFLNDASQSRNAFLQQALNLSECAFASLIIDAPPARPQQYQMSYHNFTDPRRDLIAYKQAVLDIRRSIDLLEQHPRIDHNRIAFIGNGDGAMTGAITSGIESRILTYILMACTPSYSRDLRYSNSPMIVKARNSLSAEQITQYEKLVELLNPSNYLPYHRRSLIFFQFAQNDPGFDEKASKELFQITEEPKIQKIYKTTNSGMVTFEEVIKDQNMWLNNHL